MQISVHHSSHQLPFTEQLAQDRLFIGQLKDFVIKLHISPTVVSVAQPVCLQNHLHKQVIQELEHLEQTSIIEDIKVPTPWTSPSLYTARWNHSLQYRYAVGANEAIECEHHSNPIVDRPEGWFSCNILERREPLHHHFSDSSRCQTVSSFNFLDKIGWRDVSAHHCSISLR